MQNFFRNHSRLIQTPLIHEGGIKKRYIKYCSVSVLIFFLTACATTPTVTQRPPMQSLTGEITEEKVDSEVKINDDILVFHKTQGRMPIKFRRVDKEYLFFVDIDETQNLHSVMDGIIHLKDIDRIEGIKRAEITAGTAPKRAEIAAGAAPRGGQSTPGELKGEAIFFKGFLPLFLLFLLL